ncbi:MAG TPA: hypothetical protein VGE16_17060 [Albitalea sp.]
MTPPAPFFRASVRASLPLWWWALHFAFCYVGLAAGCTAGWDLGASLLGSPLRTTLVLGSAIAVAGAAALLLHAWRQSRTVDGALLARVRLAAAAMALIGIAWTSVPLLLLPLCRLA